MLEDYKKTVLDYAKRGAMEGLFAGTSGNLSLYEPGSKYVIITPTSIDYKKMTLEDIMVIDLDGNIIEGPTRPSSEWRLHAAVYRAKPEMTAVVHTHSPYATSFSVTHEEIPIILIEMLPFLGGTIRVADYALPGTEAVGEAAVKAMGSHRLCCLLGNHGALAVGPYMEKAYRTAVYVEDSAKIYHYAKTAGTVHAIEGENLKALYEKYHIPMYD